MRILCLHGIGSSASVLESQLQPLMGVIDAEHEFVFVDGFVEVARGPGVPSYHPGPFFSHLRGYSPSEVLESVNHLRTIIDEDGPFDGVLGFSQGASILISYIYHHQRRDLPLNFKFAIILSATVAWATDATYCQDIIQNLCASSRASSRASSPAPDSHPCSSPSPAKADSDTGPTFTPIEREFITNTLAAVELGRQQGLLDDYIPSSSEEFFLREDESVVPRPLFPPVLQDRIRIPTVHMRGKRDADFMSMSKNGYGLCEESMARSLMHGGGHHPPMKVHEVNALKRAMSWAIETAVAV